MNVDWNAFNQNMQNMAASMQQMTSAPHFNPPHHPYNMQPTHQPYPPLPFPDPFGAPPQPQQPQPQPQAPAPPPPQMQQSFLVPTIPITLPPQPMQPMQPMQPIQPIQPQQPPLVFNDLNDFAQRITAYSQQMVQSIHSAINQQNMNQMHNSSIVLQPQSHHSTVQQIFIHNNNGQQQIHQIQHITAPPLLFINNQSFTIHPPPNADVIDLTNGDDEEQDGDTEEYKEVFVPWSDEEVPNEYKCPISLEIMSDPVILSDGFYYEREYIEDWLRSHNRSPMTNLPLDNPTLTTDHAFRCKINKWKQTQWELFDARNQEEEEEEYSESASQYSEDYEAESQHMELFMEHAHDHDHDVKMKM